MVWKRSRMRVALRARIEVALRLFQRAPVLADHAVAVRYVETEWQPEKVRQRYDWLFEYDIGDDGYCSGTEPGLADVYLVPALSAARQFSVPLDSFPGVLRAEALAISHPAFVAARPSRQEASGSDQEVAEEERRLAA
jgi:glutathione S-transferase